MSSTLLSIAKTAATGSSKANPRSTQRQAPCHATYAQTQSLQEAGLHWSASSSPAADPETYTQVSSTPSSSYTSKPDTATRLQEGPGCRNHRKEGAEGTGYRNHRKQGRGGRNRPQETSQGRKRWHGGSLTGEGRTLNEHWKHGGSHTTLKEHWKHGGSRTGEGRTHKEHEHRISHTAVTLSQAGPRNQEEKQERKEKVKRRERKRQGKGRPSFRRQVHFVPWRLDAAAGIGVRTGHDPAGAQATRPWRQNLRQGHRGSEEGHS